MQQVDYCIAQATVGTWIDSAYAGDARTIHAYGKMLGAYHYGMYGPGPTRQARAFLSVVNAGPLAQFLAIDAEARGSNRLLAHPATITALIVNVRKLDIHKRPILLYSSRATSVIVNGNNVSIWKAITAQDDNWVADYVGAPDRVVSPSVPWRLWQYSGTGIDKDAYHGSVAQMKAWLT